MILTGTPPVVRARSALREGICYLLPMTYDQLRAELRAEYDPKLRDERLDLALSALVRAKEIRLRNGVYHLVPR
jgi:hypothetical protein